MRGRVQIESVGSVVLKENALRDPRLRHVPVYLPPSYGTVRGRRYPVIYCLAGFTSTGRSFLNFNPWRENLPERFDRLLAAGRAREAVLVMPDCFTALGGSQYLNSSATGRYEDHVVHELVAFFEDKLSLSRRPAGRAIVGKSSGGYGALMLAMKHPDVFGHAASHSGDMFFEVCYGGDIPKFVTALGKYSGSVDRFLKAFLAARDKEGFDHALVNLTAMSACYSPNPKSRRGFDLPCDCRTGEIVPEVWARWKALDPVCAAARFRANLKKLKTIFFDCGTRDEFHLHLGARKFAQALKNLGVRHDYEEHGLGHFDMAERWDRSLALLSRQLKA
ncbi:MAG TPA: esterase [Elusimicrobia bacterium]|nr:esterase [Elusimicrobiota bacterium]HBT62012.1 esterase [Elusimicrobiota bacterium]